VPLAIKGYDPVAYFTDKRPIVGNPQYQHEWDGAVYRFASTEHLALFTAEPDRYLPQFNNWCAASVAKGEKVYGNPEWWLVVDWSPLSVRKADRSWSDASGSGHGGQGGQELVESLTAARPAGTGLHGGGG
jgi:YHS domain-containing protein